MSCKACWKWKSLIGQGAWDSESFLGHDTDDTTKVNPLQQQKEKPNETQNDDNHKKKKEEEEGNPP
jgi:hypothetical protein